MTEPVPEEHDTWTERKIGGGLLFTAPVVFSTDSKFAAQFRPPAPRTALTPHPAPQVLFHVLDVHARARRQDRRRRPRPARPHGPRHQRRPVADTPLPGLFSCRMPSLHLCITTTCIHAVCDAPPDS